MKTSRSKDFYYTCKYWFMHQKESKSVVENNYKISRNSYGKPNNFLGKYMRFLVRDLPHKKKNR